MTLRNALDLAIDLTKGNREEEGGVIIHQADTDEYEFVHLRNANTGTPIAPSLFTADPIEFVTKVAKRFKDGWRMHSSFHTHPAFTPYASAEDRRHLFKGFALNFIYAPRFDAIFRYPVDKEHNTGNPTYVVRTDDTLVEESPQLFQTTFGIPSFR